MGASLASLWVANAVISFAFPLLAEHVGSIPIYVGFMVLNIIVVLFVARYVPETKGRTLEEMESDLRTRYGGPQDAGSFAQEAESNRK